jgi:hypothetical protein
MSRKRFLTAATTIGVLAFAPAATAFNIAPGGANESTPANVAVSALGNWRLSATYSGKLTRAAVLEPARQAYTLANDMQIKFGSGSFEALSTTTGRTFDGSGIDTVPVTYKQELTSGDVDNILLADVFTTTVTYTATTR